MCSHWPHKLTWRAFFCTIIAAFTFTAVMNTDLGSGLSPGGSVVRDSLVLNIASTDGMHTWRYADFAWAAILGVLGGVLGAGCTAAIVLTLTLTLNLTLTLTLTRHDGLPVRHWRGRGHG